MSTEFIKAALHGLCSSPEVSLRSPKSIAEKAVQIAQAVQDIIDGKVDIKEYKK